MVNGEGVTNRRGNLIVTKQAWTMHQHASLKKIAEINELKLSEVVRRLVNFGLQALEDDQIPEWVFKRG